MNDAHTATGPRRRGAPPAGQRLTREAVLTRAEALIDRDGVAAFSLRALSRELAVRPAALYNHVTSRDELLQAVTERFVAGFDLTGVGEQPWPQWVRSVAVDLRRRMLDHPERAELVLTRAPGTPASRTFLQRFLDDLVAAGLERSTAHVAWHVMMAVVIGVVQVERPHGPDPAGTFDAVLDVALDGILVAASRPPSDHMTALLHAHHSADEPTSSG
ncbi:MAG: TetR/AcrR family transcriptional regulator [Pseudonocardia sp.]|nr:TetR/AcrR family transcriptional regulator [Pseudonocardia sp.]